MGKIICRKLPVRAALRPDFQAGFKSTDYPTLEPLFQTPLPSRLPPAGGSTPPPPPKPFCHLRYRAMRWVRALSVHATCCAYAMVHVIIQFVRWTGTLMDCPPA